jgi:hypothetical protein
MRVRTTLILTAIMSMIVGAIVIYLVLSVPNDLRADALLKQARQDLGAGKTEDARTSLRRIVQQYPRTDAAAAATVALVTIADTEHQKLRRELTTVKTSHDRAIADLQKSVTEIKNTPPPKPQIIVQQAPAPKPAPKKAPVKRTPSRRRR